MRSKHLCAHCWWEQTADRRAIIPMAAGIDSLNVAAAAAVACYVTARRHLG